MIAYCTNFPRYINTVRKMWEIGDPTTKKKKILWDIPKDRKLKVDICVYFVKSFVELREISKMRTSLFEAAIR